MPTGSPHSREAIEGQAKSFHLGSRAPRYDRDPNICTAKARQSLPNVVPIHNGEARVNEHRRELSELPDRTSEFCLGATAPQARTVLVGVQFTDPDDARNERVGQIRLPKQRGRRSGRAFCWRIVDLRTPIRHQP
jgi:hypothetical protein